MRQHLKCRRVRCIEWFSRRTEKLIGEEEIKNFDLEYFKKIFRHEDEDDPEITGGDYEILVHHIGLIQPFIKHKINLKKYCYFFSTYRDNRYQVMGDNILPFNPERRKNNL